MLLISSIKSSKGLSLIFDSFFTLANFSLAVWLESSIVSSSEKWRPLLLHSALFKRSCPFSIWFIFFYFCNLAISSKMSTLFCFNDSSMIASYFDATIFLSFLNYSPILTLMSADLSFICWQFSEGFLYYIGGFLLLVWYPMSSLVKISINLSKVMRLFPPSLCTTPPTAFNSQPEQVKDGLNSLPNATLEAGFF